MCSNIISSKIIHLHFEYNNCIKVFLSFLFFFFIILPLLNGYQSLESTITVTEFQTLCAFYLLKTETSRGSSQLRDVLPYIQHYLHKCNLLLNSEM